MHNHEPAGYQCVFCMFVQGGEGEYNKRNDIVFDNGRVLAFVSPRWWRGVPGNTLVVPYGHFENVYDIPDDVLAEVGQVGKKVALAMKESYGCDGVYLHQNNEPAGDQEIWHFHLHVMPRWKNDQLHANYGDSKYVSEEDRRPYADKLRAEILA